MEYPETRPQERGGGETTAMKVFLNFLVELFTLTSVWVERGYGRWVLSRRMHPALRAFLTISLMIFGIV